MTANDYRTKEGGFSLLWIDDFKQLLHNQTYFIATEFFGNYPIHKFQVIALHERRRGGTLSLVLSCLTENTTGVERGAD